jgi:His/Glu/Gln/Arg/opine family amino acid ABC transporter permease subunit
VTVPDWIPPVAHNVLGGLQTTIVLSVTTTLAATLLGLLLGSLVSLRSPLVVLPIRGYVELWRGLPLILTLFFLFFMLPAVGIRVPALYAAIMGLTLWTSANYAEIVRGAIRSIPAGQTEAATALGLRFVQTMRYVILPQAMRRMLPPYVSLLANLIQATALTTFVGVLELTGSAQRQIARLTVLGDAHSVAIFSAVMVTYLLICLPLTRLSALMAGRLLG